MEAVLQTSTRAYLIGKATGEANVIFIDKDGRQVVTLEVTVERDLLGLERVYWSSSSEARTFKVETHQAVSIVLTGTVQNPIDATRAGEIATQAYRCRPKGRRPEPTTTSRH